jgi:catechol 2,3-dioxygenase-like lactoylglutathione lyase family enzyme
MVTGLGQIAYAVENVERSTKFLRDQVGLPFLFSAPPGLSFFDLGGVRLMIGRPQGAGMVGANSVLYLRCGDIQAAYRELSARGVHFDREPMALARMPDHELWMAFFRDPDGNLLALMEERR